MNADLAIGNDFAEGRGMLARLPYEATPFVLAVGPFAGGLITRSIVLAPMLREQPQVQVARSSSTTSGEPLVGAPLGKAVHHAR